LRDWMKGATKKKKFKNKIYNPPASSHTSTLCQLNPDYL